MEHLERAADLMSAGTYSTTVDILGDTDPGDPPPRDEWGDPIEEDDLVKANVPASITEKHRTVATESEPQAITIHYYTGRLPHGTPVTRAHRLRDRRTGEIYQVDYVNAPNAVAMPGDVRVDLRRVT